MNKYQEALNDFSKTIKVINGKPTIINNEYDASKFVLYESQIRTLQELVDKATPMKLEQKGVNELSSKTGFCPSCKEQQCELDNRDYCGDCGQALDWSNNE